MRKLFQIRFINLFTDLKTHFETPKSRIPISHSHTFSKTVNPNSMLGFVYKQVETFSSSKPTEETTQLSLKINENSCGNDNIKENESTAQISHPWPEWVDLMDLLLKKGYFAESENPFRSTEFGGKDANFARTACLNFARDRYGLMRCLSSKDIQVIVGYGCPSLDRKVVNSGKRLRSLVGINEGNVCSSCNLRGDCDRAYVKARQDEGGRTVDVMRILFTYGLDSLDVISIHRQGRNKTVEESVRRLLKDIVEYSIQLDTVLPNGSLSKSASSPVRHHSSIKVPKKKGDWICQKCNFVNFSRNIKCLHCNDLSQERLIQLKKDQDHLPLKKGDWICERCNYLNFARNTRCLQCEEKPPKRHLNPGEWECESCNYINFRKNMVCLKCDHKRPKASKASKITKPESEGRYLANRSVSSFSFGDFETNDNKCGEVSKSSQSKGASVWRFVDEEREDNDFSISGDSGFVDFPIRGGKSSLSQNSEKRKKWTQHMVKNNKGTARTIERNEKRRDANIQWRFEDVESPCDDDFSGWFGEKRDSEAELSICAYDINRFS